MASPINTLRQVGQQVVNENNANKMSPELSKAAKGASIVAVGTIAAFVGVELLAGIAIPVVATGVFFSGVALSLGTLCGLVDPTTSEGRQQAVNQCKNAPQQLKALFTQTPIPVDSESSELDAVAVEVEHPHITTGKALLDYAKAACGNSKATSNRKYEALKGAVAQSANRLSVDAVKAGKVAVVTLLAYGALLIGAGMVTSVVAGGVVIGGLSVAALTLAGVVDPMTKAGRASMLESCSPAINFCGEKVGKFKDNIVTLISSFFQTVPS